MCLLKDAGDSGSDERQGKESHDAGDQVQAVVKVETVEVSHLVLQVGRLCERAPVRVGYAASLTASTAFLSHGAMGPYPPVVIRVW